MLKPIFEVRKTLKKTKFRRISSVGMAILASAMLAGHLSAQTAPEMASDKTQYNAGTTVTLNSKGWGSGEYVNIVVDDDQDKSWKKDVDLQADEDGVIRYRFSLPSTFVGNFAAVATGEQSEKATASFTDVPSGTPGLISDKDDYAPGETAWLGGWDFDPGEAVFITISIDDPTLGIHVTDYDWTYEYAADNGQFLADYLVPDEALNMTLTATATGVDSGKVATATFTDAASVSSISPTSGSRGGGTQVTITGAGFTSSGGPYTVTFDGIQAASVSRSDNNTLYATAPAHATGTSKVVVFANGNAVALQTDKTGSVAQPTFNYTNTAPVATAASVSTNQDSSKLITLSGTDADKDPLTFKITSLPANGQLRVGNTTSGQPIHSADLPATVSGDVTYTPNSSYSGSDSFGFKANDGNLDSAQALDSLSVVQTAANTTISSVSGGGTYGSTNGTLTATLSASNGVAGKSIVFAANGKSYTGTTNSNGVATVTGVDLTGLDAGSFSNAVLANFGGDSSFKASNSSGTLVIGAANLTVTPHNKTKVYGDTDVSLGGDISGVQSGDIANASYSAGAAASSPVGNYEITVPAISIKDNNGKDKSKNYNATLNKATLTVTKAPLTVSATSASRVYGDANPAFTGTLSGIKNNDAISLNVTTNADQGSDASSYAVIADVTDNGSGKLNNYSVTKNNGTLTVTKAPLTVTAKDATREYGDANPTFEGTIAGLKNLDNIKFGGNSAADLATSVGTYDIASTLSDPDGKLKNYTVNSSGGKLTITPAPLSVAADDATREYGDANPVFSAKATGIKNNDAISASAATVAEKGTDVGEYAITPAVSGTKASNYSVTKANGKLTITKAKLSVSATDATREYGDANPVFSGALTGVKNSDNITGTYGSTVDVTANVGSYGITPGVDDHGTGKLKNYDVATVPGALKVTPAPLTVSANDVSREYGDDNPTFSNTVKGIKNNDEVVTNATASADKLSDVGTFDITPSAGGDKITNYNVTKNKGTLKVTPAGLTLSANDATREYGAANPTFNGKAVGAKNGDVITVDGTTSATATSDVVDDDGNLISYAIVPAAKGDKIGNYKVNSKTEGKLTLTKANLGVTAGNTSREYGDANPDFSATLSGVKNGDAVAAGASTSATQDSNVGEYEITAGASDNNSGKLKNYNVKPVHGKLTITKANLALATSGDKAGEFGDDLGAFTATFKGKLGQVFTVNANAAPTDSADAGDYEIKLISVNDDQNKHLGNYNQQNGGLHLGWYKVSQKAVVVDLTVAPASQQYSDLVTFTATATPGVVKGQRPATHVGFYVGTQLMGVAAFGDPDATGQMTATLTKALLETVAGQMAPSTTAKTVTAVLGTMPNGQFTGGLNRNFHAMDKAKVWLPGSGDRKTAPMTITAENATAQFTGDLWFSASTTSSTTANAVLTANVQDVNDGNRGDISKAQVQFINRNNGSILATVPVGLMNSADPTQGIASATVALPIGTDGSSTYTIGTKVIGYYQGAADNDNQNVTVALPLNTSFITGGGYIINPLTAGGSYGQAGQKTNFGFGIKYNKGMTNLMGNANIIVRKDGNVYQIKSNAISSLTVDPATGTATFYSKANIQDVTDPTAPISLGGNATLKLQMKDAAAGDTIGIQVLDGSNTLVYSSSWTGTATALTPLIKGNLVVH